MDTDKIRESYAAIGPLELPYKTKFGFTLGDVHGFCPSCDKELDNLRGKLNEYQHCIEVRLFGLCNDCKLIVECTPIRHYSDGRFMMRHEKFGWGEVKSGSHSGTLLKVGLVVATIVAIVTALIVLF